MLLLIINTRIQRMWVIGKHTERQIMMVESDGFKIQTFELNWKRCCFSVIMYTYTFNVYKRKSQTTLIRYGVRVGKVYTHHYDFVRRYNRFSSWTISYTSDIITYIMLFDGHLIVWNVLEIFFAVYDPSSPPASNRVVLSEMLKKPYRVSTI